MFVGTVTSVHFQREDENAGWFYVLNVTKLYRGPKQSVIQVFTEDASERFPLTKDQTYLLFAHDFPGGLEIESCGNSTEISRAADAVGQIERVLREMKSAAGGWIEGRIVKGSGALTGVSGIPVGVEDGGTIYKAVTDNNGWFGLHISAGKYTVRIRTSNWLVSTYDMSYDRPDNVVVLNGRCVELQFLAYPE